MVTLRPLLCKTSSYPGGRVHPRHVSFGYVTRSSPESVRIVTNLTGQLRDIGSTLAEAGT